MLSEYEYDSEDEICEKERLEKSANILWRAITSGQITTSVLDLLETITDQCVDDGAILSMLCDDPFDGNFDGAWGENQHFPSYLGAMWKMLLMRKPELLEDVFVDEKELADLGKRLIAWGTEFESRSACLPCAFVVVVRLGCCRRSFAHHDRLSPCCCADLELHCDLYECPGLPLTDDWEDDTEEYGSLETFLADYDFTMPPTGLKKELRSLGVFWDAACRAYELSEMWNDEEDDEEEQQVEPAAKKAKCA